ncbi:MAG: YegP family protein [Bacteroidales bacterium]|nr:YegP family protein [Bacteroidales bacterium]
MAKFEVYQSGKKNEFRFRLTADNGQTILSSEGYATKAACLNGIASVKKNAKDPKRVSKTKTPGKMFRFAVIAGNNEIIGISQNYTTESGRDNEIDSVKRNATKVEIKEVKK